MKKEIKEGAFIYCSKDNAPYNLMGVITEDGLNLFLKLIRDCFVLLRRRICIPNRGRPLSLDASYDAAIRNREVSRNTPTAVLEGRGLAKVN